MIITLVRYLLFSFFDISIFCLYSFCFQKSFFFCSSCSSVTVLFGVVSSPFRFFLCQKRVFVCLHNLPHRLIIVSYKKIKIVISFSFFFLVNYYQFPSYFSCASNPSCSSSSSKFSSLPLQKLRSKHELSYRICHVCMCVAFLPMCYRVIQRDIYIYIYTK